MRGLIAIAAVPALGFLGQRLAEARDRRRFPMPGRLVDADGAAIHVIVDGAGPVVVIDSGLGGSSIEWAAVAADLSHDFTVVRYDRPGFGWSPPATIDPSPAAAARRIRELLATLGLPVPAILVGHSLGGIHVRLAASLYPEIVSGLVLVDPSDENMLDAADASRSAAVASRVMRIIAAAAPFGVARIAGRLYGRMVAREVRGPVDCAAREALTLSTLMTACSVGGLRAAVTELTALPTSLRQVKELSRDNGLPRVPVTVVSADAPARSRSEQAARTAIRTLHEAQATATPLGRLVLATTSGHLVPVDQPELIATCVRETAAARAAGTWAATADAQAVLHRRGEAETAGR